LTIILMLFKTIKLVNLNILKKENKTPNND